MKFSSFFNTWVRDSRMWREMALGTSFSSMHLRVSPAMGFFLSFIPGESNQAKAMQWLMTEGLVAASKGRDKLYKLVKAQMAPQAAPAAAAQSFRKAESVTNEAKNAFGVPKTSGELHPTDLFSPAARKRLGLDRIQIDGQSIDDYYATHFEPKSMTISTGVKEYRVSIPKINEYLTHNGLPNFKYGGTDGYLEYIEKGDDLPEHEQRHSSDPNKHHGPDLSSASEEYDEDGNPIVQFQGGAVSANPELFSRRIAGLKDEFARTKEAIESGKTTQIDPRHQELYKKFFKNLEAIKRSEDNRNPEELGIQRKSPVELTLPYPDRLNDIMDLAKQGLEGFTATVDGKEVTLDPQQAAQVLDRFFGASARKSWSNPEQGKIVGQLLWKDVFPELTQNRNNRLYLYQVLNSGMKKLPKESKENLKRNLYVLKRGTAHPGTFMTTQKYDEHELTPEMEGELTARGYQYKPNEKGTTFTYEVGHHKLYGRIVRDPNDPNNGDKVKKYIKIPSDKPGDPFSDGTEDNPLDRYALAGGTTGVSSGKSYGHLNMRPPRSKETWDTMFKDLQRGKYGERFGYEEGEEGPQAMISLFLSQFYKWTVQKGTGTDHKQIPASMAIPSVVLGTLQGMKYAENKVSLDGRRQYQPGELINLGLEGLFNFAGDKAFRIGHVSPGEQEALKMDSPDKQIATELTPKTGEGNDKYGRGIHAIMARNGITDPQQQQAYIDTLMKNDREAGAEGDFETTPGMSHYVPQDVADAFEENALQARIRAVGQYVMAAIMRNKKASMSRKDNLTASALAGDDGDGGSTDGYDTSDRGYEVGDNLGAAGFKKFDRDELRTTFGSSPTRDTVGAQVQRPVAQPPVQAPVQPPKMVPKQSAPISNIPPSVGAQVPPGSNTLRTLMARKKPPAVSADDL